MSKPKTIIKAPVARRKPRVYTGSKALIVNGSTLTVTGK